MLDDLVWYLFDISLTLGIGIFAPNETLGGKESVFRIDNSLAFGGYADKSLPILRKGDYGGSSPRA